MSTYLGSCQELSVADIDEEMVRASAISYFEGYLWDRPGPMAAIGKAAAIARASGRRTAMTLSDTFCVEGHRDDFLDLVANRLDIVFANENEARALFATDDLDVAVAGFARHGLLAVVTRSEKGAVVVRGDERIAVPAAPAARVLDTTGAGDLFAAGFLAGLSRGRPLRECAMMGTVAAAEIIEHYGARAEADLVARMRGHGLDPGNR
jgi:sugar/nucleoside kinase (ribokinase family)